MLQVNQMQSHYEGKETSGKLADAAESPDDLKVRPQPIYSIVGVCDALSCFLMRSASAIMPCH